jgi:hydroxymethylglutaryl-CoA reductase (NADPH)
MAITVPSFLLKRVYAKGSLKNNDSGFQFDLKNSLGSGYAKELFPLALDGQEVPKEKSFFILEGKEICFTAVGETTPFTLTKNKAATILVKGTKLNPGAHKLGISFVVQGIGKLQFDVTDTVVG